MQDPTTTENSAGLAEAFQAVFASAKGPDPVQEPVAVAAVAVSPQPQVAEQVVEQSATPAEVPPAESPELTQLRADLEAARTERDSMARRSAESIDWARKGFLRKSSEAARAREILSRAATSGELDKAELERFLASGSGELQPTAPQQSEQELMAIDASKFAFRYGLTEKGIADFSGWIGSPAAQTLISEDDTVNGNYYQTLRNYYERYREATSRPDPAVAQAAGTIARVQKEVARAAAAPPSRVMPTEAPEAIDPMKMTVQEREDSGLIQKLFSDLTKEYRQ